MPYYLIDNEIQKLEFLRDFFGLLLRDTARSAVLIFVSYLCLAELKVYMGIGIGSFGFKNFSRIRRD